MAGGARKATHRRRWRGAERTSGGLRKRLNNCSNAQKALISARFATAGGPRARIDGDVWSGSDELWISAKRSARPTDWCAQANEQQRTNGALGRRSRTSYFSRVTRVVRLFGRTNRNEPNDAFLIVTRSPALTREESAAFCAHT